jgi:hypothetical protein
MDSMNHIPAPLRSFPEMFFGEAQATVKGMFPYDILMEENWRERTTCPDHTYFGITSLEWENRDKVSSGMVLTYLSDTLWMTSKYFTKAVKCIVELFDRGYSSTHSNSSLCPVLSLQRQVIQR